MHHHHGDGDDDVNHCNVDGDRENNDEERFMSILNLDFPFLLKDLYIYFPLSYYMYNGGSSVFVPGRPSWSS